MNVFFDWNMNIFIAQILFFLSYSVKKNCHLNFEIVNYMNCINSMYCFDHKVNIKIQKCLNTFSLGGTLYPSPVIYMD